MKMKSILAIVLVLVMALSLAACGGGSTPASQDTPSQGGSTPAAPSQGGSTPAAPSQGGSTPAAPSQGGSTPAAPTSAGRDTLTAAFSRDRGTLDPAYLMGYDSLAAMMCVYDALWELDSEGNIMYNVATELKFLSDTVWQITIRDDVTFANGDKMDAKDVAFSIELGNKREGEPNYFPYMTECVATGDYTVEMHLTQFDLSYVSSVALLPLHNVETYEKDAIALNPIGSGPYVVDDYVVNSHLYLTARDDYWGEKPAIKNLHFELITEDAQKTNALQTGELDISVIPSQDVDFIKSLGSYGVFIGPSGQANDKTLYFNATSNSILGNNPDARKAVAMAIDKEAICDLVYNGFAVPSRLGCSARNTDILDSYLDLGVYANGGYNPEAARALAEKAGLIGQTLTISTDGTSDDVLMAESIQDDLKAIGVNCEVKNYDTGSWFTVYTDATNCGDMYLDMTSSPSSTAAQAISVWFLYGLGGAYTGPDCDFEGKDILIAESNRVMSIQDDAERGAVLQQLIDIETEALIWYNLVDLDTTIAYNSDIQGFALKSDGNVFYKFLSWA